MKAFWNVARMKTLTSKEREALIVSIMAKMRGNILQVTLRHDASRAVQCVLQFGTLAQRKEILTEMGDRISEVRRKRRVGRVILYIWYGMIWYVLVWYGMIWIVSSCIVFGHSIV